MDNIMRNKKQKYWKEKFNDRERIKNKQINCGKVNLVLKERTISFSAT